MKKFITTFALVASLGFASFSFAANENLAALSEVKSANNKVKVTLREGLGKVRVAVLDSKGKYMHQQTVFVKNDVILPIDLSQLPVGEYHVMIENAKDGDRTFTTIETKTPPSAYPLMAYRKHIDDNSFKLTVIGLDQPGVNVEILDRQGKKIYGESINEPEAFTKVYHLANLKNDEVSVRVVDSKGRSKSLFE